MLPPVSQMAEGCAFLAGNVVDFPLSARRSLRRSAVSPRGLRAAGRSGRVVPQRRARRVGSRRGAGHAGPTGGPAKSWRSLRCPKPLMYERRCASRKNEESARRSGGASCPIAFHDCRAHRRRLRLRRALTLCGCSSGAIATQGRPGSRADERLRARGGTDGLCHLTYTGFHSPAHGPSAPPIRSGRAGCPRRGRGLGLELERRARARGAECRGSRVGRAGERIHHAPDPSGAIAARIIGARSRAPS